MIENDQSMTGTLLCRVPETGQRLLSPGEQIVVRDGEAAVLICQGAVRGVFAAGQCAIPQNCARESAVYYCNVEPIPLKWVTRVPLAIVVDKAGTMEPLRAFGMVAVRVVDAGRFVAYMVGERELVQAEDIHTWVQTQFTRALWFELDELSPVLDLDAAASDVVPGTQARLVRAFEGTGLAVGQVSIVMLKWWKTLGLAQAADQLGYSKEYVIELIHRGQLRIVVP